MKAEDGKREVGVGGHGRLGKRAGVRIGLRFQERKVYIDCPKPMPTGIKQVEDRRRRRRRHTIDIVVTHAVSVAGLYNNGVVGGIGTVGAVGAIHSDVDQAVAFLGMWRTQGSRWKGRSRNATG